MDTNASEYKTVREAAEAWGVSIRYVNMCIKEGRINGAKKMGNMWIMPKDAERPHGSRRKSGSTFSSLSKDLSYVLASTNIPAPLANPDSIVDMIDDESLKVIPTIALAYGRGDFQYVKRRFNEIEEDGAVKLCVCSVALLSSIGMGDFQFFQEIEDYLKCIVKANMSASVTAYAELTLAVAYVSAGALSMAPEWLKTGDFAALPPQVIPSAALMRVQYFRWRGNPELTLALAQTLLPFVASERGLSFDDTNLRLICAAACCALDRRGEAERHLLDAFQRNIPHGFIVPFAETMPLFDGMMEQLLEKKYPKQSDAVISLCKHMLPNWLSFHNHFAKENITLILSLREYEIALLAVKRVPYTKIAELHGISVSRLKGIMDVIHEKLFVRNRDELAQYIL